MDRKPLSVWLEGDTHIVPGEYEVPPLIVAEPARPPGALTDPNVPHDAPGCRCPLPPMPPLPAGDVVTPGAAWADAIGRWMNARLDRNLPRDDDDPALRRTELGDPPVREPRHRWDDEPGQLPLWCVVLLTLAACGAGCWLLALVLRP